jgi:3-deoxy-D-manno-octulosonic-acid transferase
LGLDLPDNCVGYRRLLINFLMIVTLLLYRFFLLLYVFGVRVAALKSIKARQWLRGRRGIRGRIKEAGEGFHADGVSDPVFWFHCASLGEFEQGRPLMEAIKKQNPKARLVVTFFSPSGYEIRKSYPGADYIDYLPIDGPGNAAFLVRHLQPTAAFFIKYEFWYYYLSTLKKKNIPVFLISGIFREGQPFFRWYGYLHRYMLDSFRHLFVQNEKSAQLLLTIGQKNCTVSGDTRFDRVLQTANNTISMPLIEQFIQDAPVLVAGSTWTEDEEELDHYARIHPELKFIIAPHEVDIDNIQDIESLFPNSIRYSEWAIAHQASAHPLGIVPEWTPPIQAYDQAGSTASTSGLSGRPSLQERVKTANTLLIDNIGMLSSLYRYATVAYVGGGFGDNGLHNILEPAVFGKPVIFGPNYGKFPEAEALLETGGAFSVSNALELEELLDELFQQNGRAQEAGIASANFIQQSSGATETIIKHLSSEGLL